MEQQVAVQITPHSADDGVRYSARVNGAEFPVQAFSVEPDEQGRVFVSLVVEASAVQVGAPAEAKPQQLAETKPPRVSTWGDPSLPDPRESLPGWDPERLGAMVAKNTAGRPA